MLASSQAAPHDRGHEGVECRRLPTAFLRNALNHRASQITHGEAGRMPFRDNEQGGCSHAGRSLAMPAGFHDPMVFLDVGVGHCSSWRRGSSWSGPRLLALGATAAFVDGRGSRLGVGRMPLAGAGAPAASGSRSWCRRRRCRARRWRPPHRWWPGRRRAAPRTAAAAPRSAGPGPGRAKSPPEQVIEQVFGTESGMLPTATGWTAGGTLGAQSPGLHGSTADNPGEAMTW
jgi:hypothetical protein